MVWDWVGKEVFMGTDILELGVYDAAFNFNTGSQAALNILTNTGIEPGEFGVEEMKLKKWQTEAQQSNLHGEGFL